MAENVFSSFAISSQGMSVERQRLSAVAKNIANANTTKSADGKPYQREIIVVHAKAQSKFDESLENQILLSGTNVAHTKNFADRVHPQDTRVLNAKLDHDSAPPRMVYDPSHPDADTEGYVHMPNVNVVTEMVEMISAQRSFEANTSVVSAAKNMARDSMEI